MNFTTLEFDLVSFLGKHYMTLAAVLLMGRQLISKRMAEWLAPPRTSEFLAIRKVH